MAVSTTTAGLLQAPETRRYLEATVRIWLGLPTGSGVDVPALPERLARLLLRLEEHENPHRDRWDCWAFGFSENFRAGRLWVPEIDRWVARRRAELEAATTLEPLWPDGRRFAVCVSHDVDLLSAESTVRQTARYARAGAAPDGTAGAHRLIRFARPPVRVARTIRTGIVRVPSTEETLERSVAIESSRGVTASYLFTVPPEDGPGRYDCVYAPGDPCRFRGRSVRIADVMRTLAAEGFDVGLHGSYAAGTERGALAHERAVLEDATGLEISTARQHFLHWDVRTTPVLQEAAGLRVDSSLGFNANAGFRAGTSLPFRLFEVPSRRTLELLEIPLVAQDGALLGPIGLELDLATSQSVVRQLLDTAAETGGAVTFDFHPDKLVRPDWLALFEWTLDHALGEGAWLTSLADLERWWRQREARILAD